MVARVPHVLWIKPLGTTRSYLSYINLLMAMSIKCFIYHPVGARVTQIILGLHYYLQHFNSLLVARVLYVSFTNRLRTRVTHV